MSIAIFDTNIIIQDTNIMEAYLNENKKSKILIPLTVLLELDKLKYDKNIGYIVRGAIRKLVALQNKYKNRFIFDTDEISEILNKLSNIDELSQEELRKFQSKTNTLNQISNDFKIIATAKKYNAEIVTKDISMSLIAESQGVKVKLLTSIEEEDYNKSYIELSASESLETIFKNVKNPYGDVYSENTNKTDFKKITNNLKNLLNINNIFDS